MSKSECLLGIDLETGGCKLTLVDSRDGHPRQRLQYGFIIPQGISHIPKWVSEMNRLFFCKSDIKSYHRTHSLVGHTFRTQVKRCGNLNWRSQNLHNRSAIGGVAWHRSAPALDGYGKSTLLGISKGSNAYLMQNRTHYALQNRKSNLVQTLRCVPARPAKIGYSKNVKLQKRKKPQ